VRGGTAADAGAFAHFVLVAVGRGAGNALVGRRLPAFTLSALPGATGFSSHDVAAAGRLVLLNFFASWCVPCLQEMPQLAALAKGGLQVWGIAYRDHPADAVGFLHRVDDPYQRIGCDLDGKAGAAFGLFGVPESFLVDRDGIVRWSWAGRLNPDVIRQDLAPLI
jgi:cytochrome c biogenesis protein CcmG/thiol:disulfide interchange protein DsbE